MTDSKKKGQKLITKQNILESLKDLGGGAVNQTGDLLKSTSEDFFRELMGMGSARVKRSGEIEAGESLQMSEVLNGKEEENKRLRAQISLERQMSSDEMRLSQEKSNQLRVQLQALTQEVVKVAQSAGNLAEATNVAVIQAPSNPGIYHILFFQNVLEFLQSFRKKIDLAATWLQSSNKRAQKKNYWNMYKKKGSSFLLSPDHYLQRSAG
ncbi:MAG: hypothetical protein UU16_C0003G0024 [Candidatus Woesebacteria bacterium GW2011_GWA2_40_7]|uniref:DUF5660 domain-containing protein n=3 Tax=Candidatus Woeseibacteriota TaxID=1752722 RepID=A0A0G0UVE2_9BACT|nr:MAG: hypothetical protein UT17_C0002G0011 [Candidatus Woesebacteria bacterium GW2011_GWB1_39_10]KKR74263.1 MAG: hypothetical protein UU16_C0003G0024 [Candidatus Woesebacteria bacterium GW2011_GWA2_40_7]KKR92638.1 MAG: hypothetical protein UU42_C0001G0242 [Candidatus Woesebacteria bacterium GW2011_GWA1_41_13b]